MPVVAEEEILEQCVFTAVPDDALDLLDRQPFVDRLITISNILSDNKKTACYAINGDWGVGKTYVLDMFEKQIRDYGQEGTTLSKFLVLHYNCWQYDYYEEPLISIVSATIDAINTEVCLLSDEKKKYITAALREIATALLDETNELIKTKTGINIKKCIAFWKSTKENAEKKINEDRSFDTYFDFKKKLQKLKSEIGSLSADQTVLFVVDELDRCLPEYTIKVLERLHHLFDDIPNVQVILAIDKEQLKHTVKQIYGYGVNVNKYLEKFIDFEIKLAVGSFNENVDAVFEDYFRYFEYKDKKTLPIEVDEFKSMIREGIDIRTSLAIYKKCKLVHELLNSEKENSDYSIMCVEVFLALLKYCGLDIKKAKGCFDISNVFLTSDAFQDGGIEFPIKGFYLLNRKLNEKNLKVLYYTFYRNQHHIRADNIWGLLLASYRLILGFDDVWYTGSYEKSRIEAYTSKFWKFLQTIS